jgi:hypothetical protein
VNTPQSGPPVSGYPGPGQPMSDRVPAPYAQPSYAGAPQPYPAGPAGPVLVGPGPTGPAPPLALMPERVEPVAGTEFGVAYLRVPPTFSGLAVGSLVAGIASILLSLAVGCIGVAMAQAGGAIGAGAFAILALVLGLGSVGLGFAAMRQVRAGQGRIAGRGLAIAGLVCGAAGVVLTAGGFVLALAVIAGGGAAGA